MRATLEATGAAIADAAASLDGTLAACVDALRPAAAADHGRVAALRGRVADASRAGLEALARAASSAAAGGNKQQQPQAQPRQRIGAQRQALDAARGAAGRFVRAVGGVIDDATSRKRG